MKSDPMRWLWCLHDLFEDHGGRNTDRAGKHDQRNQGLMTLKALGHSYCGQICRFTRVSQRLS